MNTNDQKAILGSPAQPSAVEPMESICSKPGLAKNGKPFDHVVKSMVARGEYRLERPCHLKPWAQHVPSRSTEPSGPKTA